MIKVRPSRGRPGIWEADIRFEWPEDRVSFRERVRIKGVTSKGAAERWAKDREAALLAGGKAARLASKGPPPSPAKEVPTLAEFWPLFISGYYKAERQKGLGIEGKERAFRNYLRPHFGTKRLDQFRSEDIQYLKQAMADQRPKSVNNVATALSACLKYASPEGLRGVDGVGVIERVPCRIRLLKVPNSAFSWYEVHDHRRLAELAGHADIQTTQRYMHLSPDDRNAAISTLGRFHGAQLGAPLVFPISAARN
jgi:hypothetical protein